MKLILPGGRAHSNAQVQHLLTLAPNYLPTRRDTLLEVGQLEPIDIGANSDRSPQWPRGIVGPIIHSGGFTSAALARSKVVKSVGIDAEVIPDYEQALGVIAPR